MFPSRARPTIIPQSEHQRLAGIIAHLWGNERFERPPFDFTSFVTGVAFHDQGYGYLDTLAIGGMNAEERLAAFENLAAARLPDAIADTVAAHHILRLMGEEAAWQGPRRLCQERIAAGLASTGIERDIFLWADCLTNVCDTAAFLFCFEQPAQSTIAVSPAPGAAALALDIAVDGQGQITLDPWPLRVSGDEGFVVAFEAEGYPHHLRPLLVRYRLEPV